MKLLMERLKTQKHNNREVIIPDLNRYYTQSCYAGLKPHEPTKMRYKIKQYIWNMFLHTRWFGFPSLYECITGNMYDNKFKDL